MRQTGQFTSKTAAVHHDCLSVRLPHIVALNPLDETCFPAEPAIINNNEVRNKTDNRHGIIGYLNDEAVAGQVAKALLEPNTFAPKRARRRA